MPEIVPKSLEALRELLESELDDYGLQWKIEPDDNYDDPDYFVVHINPEHSPESILNTLSFKYEKENLDDKEAKLFIELSEDNWEEVEGFSWRVKYFWMAFLEWPQS